MIQIERFMSITCGAASTATIYRSASNSPPKEGNCELCLILSFLPDLRFEGRAIHVAQQTVMIPSLSIMIGYLQNIYQAYKKKPQWFRLVILLAIAYIYFFSFIASFIQRSLVEPWDYVGMDYPFFYNAARNVLAGESPYPSEVIHQVPGADRAWGKYVYPPLFAWFLAPTTVLPILWSKKTYVYLMMFLYFLLLTPWRGKTPENRLERWCLIALLCIWGPAIETFRFGQSNWLSFFLLFFACCLCEKGDPGRQTIPLQLVVGGLAGVAGMVKLTPFIILPLLVVTGYWWVTLGVGLGAIATVLLTGLRDNYDYFFVVLPTMTDFGERPHFMSINRGVIEILQHIQHPGYILAPTPDWMVKIGFLVNLAVLGFTLLYLVRYRKDVTLPGVILVSCYLAPLLGASWFHHYSLALLPVLMVLRMKIKDLPSSLGFLVALLILIWPNFYFWFPARSVHDFLDTTFGISDELLISLSNLLVYLAILPVLIKAPSFTRLTWWQKMKISNPPIEVGTS